MTDMRIMTGERRDDDNCGACSFACQLHHTKKKKKKKKVAGLA